MAGRIIIVSNRVPNPLQGKQEAGGLVVGVREAIGDRECIWFGWSGKQIETLGTPQLKETRVGNIAYITVDLTVQRYRGFYAGFSNEILWPLCHYRPNLMDYSRSDWHSYLDVNSFFARQLAPLLRPDDTIWVHDYHLIPLGKALRAQNIQCKIGFFLHIPFPPWGIFNNLPNADVLLQTFQAYDLVGMQTMRDTTNFVLACRNCRIPMHAQAFPIGIDCEEFSKQAATGEDSEEFQQLEKSFKGLSLIVGVDRLDYSKGLLERFRGYEAFLRRYPEHRRKVSFLQIAPISRGDVQRYQSLRRSLEEAVGNINGMYAEMDWTPIRYMTRTVARSALPALYRLADVALITPLRDGMNLVAKEFIAAQDSENPGALVLSRLVGAALELKSALLVNPHDPDEIADALNQAVMMSVAERKSRWQALYQNVSSNTAAAWGKRFLEALSKEKTNFYESEENSL